MTEGSTGTAPPETIVRPSIHWVDEWLVSITRARGDFAKEKKKKAYVVNNLPNARVTSAKSWVPRLKII